MRFKGVSKILINILKFWILLTSPLKNQIKSIERNFGRGIASYFSFLKWLIFTNLFCLIAFLIPFLIGPHLKILAQDTVKNTNYSFCANENDKYLKSNSFKIDPIDILVANVSTVYL